MSCKNTNKIIFKAIQEKENQFSKIEIFDNNEYQITINETVIERGKSQVNNEIIILTPNPTSPLNTLVRNKEYKLLPNKICRIKFVQAKTDTNRKVLVKPIKEVDSSECYNIIKPCFAGQKR